MTPYSAPELTRYGARIYHAIASSSYKGAGLRPKEDSAVLNRIGPASRRVSQADLVTDEERSIWSLAKELQIHSDIA